jgi:hypothetical protein
MLYDAGGDFSILVDDSRTAGFDGGWELGVEGSNAVDSLSVRRRQSNSDGEFVDISSSASVTLSAEPSAAEREGEGKTSG